MIQNIPISEQWERKALEAVDAEAAAQMLEETKSAVLSQMMLKQGDMPVSRAEMIVKASEEWSRFVEGMVKARQHANKVRVERDYLRMRFSEWVAQDANHRAAARI
jgi:hypothetical protein